MRITEMIHNLQSSGLLDKFSLAVPWEMLRVLYGEYATGIRTLKVKVFYFQ